MACFNLWIYNSIIQQLKTIIKVLYDWKLKDEYDSLLTTSQSGKRQGDVHRWPGHGQYTCC